MVDMSVLHYDMLYRPHVGTSQVNMASASASDSAAGGGRGNDTSGRGRTGRGGRGGRGAGRTVYYGPGIGAEQPVPPSTMLYCFAHGLNSTHNGMNCRFMAQNPAYTDAMKRATCYCVIDGYYPGAPSTV
jgi:hypothetical protein